MSSDAVTKTGDRKAAVLQNLASSRARTMSLAWSLSEEQWAGMAYDEGSEWRVVDILRHVADSERGMTALIVQVKDGGEGVPADFDLARWNKRTVEKLQEKGPEQLLGEMTQNRAKLLEVIESLGPDDWDKKGRHASLQILSIEQICNLIADHERDHMAAVRAAVGL